MPELQLKLGKFLYIYIAAAMLGAKNAHQSISKIPKLKKILYRDTLYRHKDHTKNLGQIDHNLHNHVFYDIICKPSLKNDQQEHNQQ